MNKKSLILIVILMLLFSGKETAKAMDLRMRASLSAGKTSPGRQVALLFTIQGKVNIEDPRLPFVEGLIFRDNGVSSGKETVNGVETETTIYTFSVGAAKAGTYHIGPVLFKDGKNVYIAEPLILEVSKGAQADEAAVTKAQAKPSSPLAGRIFLEARLSQEKVYVNQNVEIRVELFSDWMEVMVQEINDSLTGGYISGKYTCDVGESKVIERDGTKFARLLFKKSAYFIEPGVFDLGPLTMKCDVHRKATGLLNDNESFYSRFIGKNEFRSAELPYGKPLKVEVVPLPAKGRPQNFKGAVGDFTVEVKADRQSAAIGESVTMTMVISGDGNLDTVSAPAVKDAAGFMAYEPTVQRLGDRVVAQQVLRVQSPDVKELPQIEFSFFSPTSNEYVSLKKAPLTLTVTGAGTAVTSLQWREEKKEVPVAPSQPGTKEKLGEGIVYIKDAPGRLTSSRLDVYSTKGFLFIAGLPFLMLAGAVVAKKKLARITVDRTYLARIEASKKAKLNLAKARSLANRGPDKEFYDQIFKTMQEYLSTRFLLPEGGTIKENTQALLCQQAGKEPLAEEIERIFDECYIYKFTPIKPGEEDRKNTMASADKIIKYINSARF